MNLANEILKATKNGSEKITAWGDVIGISPTTVRFAGDSADTQIDLWLTSYTPTTNDRVVLLKVGSSWVIIGDMV